MYEIAIDKEAMKFLERLPRPVRERIFKKITAAKLNPMHFFENLEGTKERKLRIGDYRVIANVNDATKRIEILYIGHRKNVYKRASQLLHAS
ncbi:MAG: type II toxin-antitoxin system RelE/ParE family toxin [Candidatus Aenigmarchaeota archaeon]|nr:type II toxin-antitoxin system RelE/ParE family toxin [Candidatus Aenigmarchaeota archaeon]